jgi:acyl-CoA synthetase (NDP forming)
VLNTAVDVRLNATFMPQAPTAGRVGFLSQSGGLGIAIVDAANRLRLGLSSFVSVGNKADLSGNDFIQYWEQDAETAAILLYLESFGNPRKFARVARRVGRTKPIVAVKSGRTPGGSRAASSHTGALAGSDQAVDALFRQSGVIRTDTIEELFDTALLLGSQPVPTGKRVAILTNAGGPGIMAADACESALLTLPTLEQKTVKALRAFLPAEASVRNPVDMIASAEAGSYEKALRLLVADKNVDSVIVIFVPPLVTGAPDVARAILAGAAGSKKPILSCFMGTHGVPESLRSLNEGHIPSYAFPEAAARTLARAAAYGEWRDAPAGKVPTIPGVDPERGKKAIERALADATEPRWMDQESLAGILAAYGVRTPTVRIAMNRGEAAVAAKSVGFPVVLKVKSPEIVHKSDIGGVKLGLRTEEEAARAFDEIAVALKMAKPDARFEGVTVESMVTGGVETIVGMTRDPLFGPVVLFGLGGVAVELLRDVSVRVAPLTDRDAEEMVREIRGYPLLDGYRGAAPSNTASLLDLLHRVSRMAVEHPEIQELDLNPVLVAPGSAPCIALDARMRVNPVAQPTAPDQELVGAGAAATAAARTTGASPTGAPTRATSKR